MSGLKASTFSPLYPSGKKVETREGGMGEASVAVRLLSFNPLSVLFIHSIKPHGVDVNPQKRGAND